MRILFISNVYPGPMQKGKGTFNQSMITSIGQRHDVRVVSPVSWTMRLSQWLKNRKIITQHEVLGSQNIKVEYPTYYYTPKWFDHLYGWMMWNSLKKYLLKTVDEFNPDVIFSYWAHPDGEVAVRLGKMIDCPVAVMVGGTDVLLLTKDKKRREAIQYVLNQSDAVIAVSGDIQKNVIELKDRDENVHVVYRGVNKNLFQLADQRKALEKLGLSTDVTHFVFAGRLVSVKGLSYLVEACRLVADKGHSFCCHLIGAGPDEQVLSKKIQELGLQGKVILEGSQSQDELADWYQAADAVILPSLSEGIPNVLLEAISCGKTFIASNVGGIPEIADERLDLLVPPSDMTKLSEAMIHRIQNPAKIVTRKFQPSSLDESAEKLEMIFQDLIDKKTLSLDLKTESMQKNKMISKI